MMKVIDNELKPVKTIVEDPYKDYPWRRQLLLIVASVIGSIAFLASSVSAVVS